MDGWIVRYDNLFDWILYWNKWKSNLFTVGCRMEYNRDNKNKRTLIRRP